MRPSILPGLIEAAGRNARRGFPDCALFEIGPVFAGDEPGDQRTAIAAILAPQAAKRWDGGRGDDLFTLKADLLALLDETGAPAVALQIGQDDPPPWWRPGRYARLQLGSKAVLAAFGEIHPRVLTRLDVAGPILAFEVWLEAIPEGRRKAVKTRPAAHLSPFMPLTRDFAFVVARQTPAGDLVRAVTSADRTLISGARVFDVYEGKGVAEGMKSIAVEVTLQPRERTLADADIEALSAKIIAAAAKAVGATLRA
jgi:phenylalanyl-tRNA synthetase beta chain